MAVFFTDAEASTGAVGVFAQERAVSQQLGFFSVSPPTCSLLAGDSDRLFAEILSSYLRPTETAKFWVLRWRCNWPRTPLVFVSEEPCESVLTKIQQSFARQWYTERCDASIPTVPLHWAHTAPRQG
jgi:hypothetical protein